MAEELKPKRKYVKSAKSVKVGRPKKASPTALMMVGTSPEVILRAETTIVCILNSPSSTEAKVAAFAALQGMCKVENVTISDCNFTN